MAFKVAVKMQLEGVAELYRKLREIDAKVAKQTMRKGITQANRLILKAAKAFVSTESKTLKKSLGSKVKVMKGGNVVVGIIGPRKDAKGKPPKYRRQVKVKGRFGMRTQIRNPVKYAHLVEFDTRPHTLGKHSTLVRKWRGKTTKLVQHGVKHPGTKAQPFLRPALEKNRGQVRDILQDCLRTMLRAMGKM